MKKKTWIWIGVIVVIVIIIAAASGSGDSGSEGKATEERVSTPKEWTELIQFNGSGDKKSVEFEYSGGKAKLKYNFKPGQYGGVFAVYVVKEGVDIETEGGFPEIMLNEGEEGESNLSHLSKGTYYLNVMSSNGKWNLSVQELK